MPEFVLSFKLSFGSSLQALNPAWMTKIRSCFLVNVIGHISSLRYISFFSSGCGKHQIAFTNTPLISVPCPMGLQLGAAVSFTIYVGTGNGSSMAREHCSPFKTGRAHCSLMHTGDLKQTNQGPEAWGCRLRRMITGDFSWCPTLFCTWSHLTVLYALVRVEGKFLFQQPEYMGGLTVSS